jgi:hypothetical protein
MKRVETIQLSKVFINIAPRNKGVNTSIEKYKRMCTKERILIKDANQGHLNRCNVGLCNLS